MNWIKRVLIAEDRRWNAIAGGSHNQTVSGRLGWLYNARRKRWSTVLMNVVDFTFYPIDGRWHCLQSYRKVDSAQADFIHGRNAAPLALIIITVLGCAVIIIPVYIIGIFVSPTRVW